MNQFTPGAPQSAIPRVMGILLIVFESLALMYLPFELLIDKSFEYLTIFDICDNVTTLIGLVAGVMAVQYRRAAIPLAIVFGVLALALTAIDVYDFLQWVYPEDVALGMIATIIDVVWPILVLVLMTRRSARASCVN